MMSSLETIKTVAMVSFAHAPSFSVFDAFEAFVHKSYQAREITLGLLS